MVLAAGSAAADGPTSAKPEPPPGVEDSAPWLRPWLPSRTPDLDPQLADGSELSFEGATGMIVSAFTTTAALGETASYGRYLASSTKQALSVEAIEKVQIALDHVTPQLGMLGVGVRRIGRRNVAGLRTIDFQRLSVGPAFASRGSNLDVGLGAGFAFGAFSFAGSGVSVSLDTYFLAPSDLTGAEKMIMITVGYIYSPITGTHIGPPRVEVPSQLSPPETTPCPDLKAYQDALVEQRRLAVDACNQGTSEECLRRKDIVTSLSTKAAACSNGQDVGPPEVDDAP